MNIFPNRKDLRMSLWIKIAILCLMAGTAMVHGAQAGQGDAAMKQPNEFKVGKGTNISHWLSQCFETMPPRRGFFSELDVIFIRSLGMDHFRLPVDEKELWTEDLEKIPEAWDYLKNALSWARKHELRVIVDLHVVRSHHFNAANEGGTNTLWDDPEAQDSFLNLWRQLSAELAYTDVDWVAYEIMNEAVADDPEDWNRLIARAHALIREREPMRTLVIGSNRWQIPSTFPDLKIPEGDPNILLSFHFYAPLLFTHYRATWVDFYPYDGPVSYPGRIVEDAALEKNDYTPAFKDKIRALNGVYDIDALEKEMQPAIEYAKQKGLPLYCGEWGCFHAVERNQRLQWYKDISTILKRNGIAHATWDYKGEFGIVDTWTLGVDWNLVGAILSE